MICDSSSNNISKAKLKCLKEKDSNLDINTLVNEVKHKILNECKLSVLPRTDTAFITKFLRVKKYDVEKAVHGIVKYYKHIDRNIELIQGMKPSTYAEAISSRSLSILKNRCGQGSTVLLGRVKNWNTKKYGLHDLKCGGMFMLEELLKDSENQLNGLSLIIDLSGLGFFHLRHVGAFEVKNCIQTFLDGLPTRVSSLHIVNAPSVFWPIYKIVMSLLPEKIKKRLHLHQSMESLHKLIDPEILPESMGGYLSEPEALDDQFIHTILKADSLYDYYWNAEKLHMARRLNRKRSSLVLTVS